MTFTLEYWRRLVNMELDEEKNPGFSIDEPGAANVISRSKEEVDRGKHLVMETMLRKQKIKDKKEYVRLLQVMLGNMEGRLSAFVKGTDNPILKSLYAEIRGHLKAFLLFLEAIFPDYFDCRQKVPAVFLNEKIKEVKALAAQLHQSCCFSSDHDHAILRLVENNFNHFLSTTVDGASLCDLLYHKTLALELMKMNGIPSDDSLKRILFFLNYNDANLCKILGEQIEAVIKALKTKGHKISALLLEQKKIHQFPVRLDFSLRTNLPSLKDQLSQWIDEEINYLQKETNVVSESTAKPTFVHVPFRGTEIYLLHKAFIDSGGTSGETYKSLFGKTASHLINNNQKGFSTESLQKNADKVNYEVKDNVKRFLQKMIRNIDSY